MSVTNDALKTALISYMKTNATITNALVARDSNANEIREVQWQGTEFVYPNIRLYLRRNIPGPKNCGYFVFTASILVFTEDQSSLQAEEISGIIYAQFHEKQVTVSGVHLSMVVTELIPAIRSDIRTWRSEVLLSGRAS